MTSSASLFVASQLRYKIKSTIKEGAAILMPLDLLFGGAAAASPKSETKWPAPETAAAKKNPVAASQTSIAAGEKDIHQPLRCLSWKKRGWRRAGYRGTRHPTNKACSFG